MASAQAYTVENLPGRKRLPWRLPAFLSLLLLSAALYSWSQPYCQVAGHYKGRIGNEFSEEKFQLIVTLVQQGDQLSGKCEVSHQVRGTMILHRGPLSGSAHGDGFRVSGLLDDGRTIYFQGSPKRTNDGIILTGETWTRAASNSQSIAFRLERQDGRIAPQDLSVKKIP